MSNNVITSSPQNYSTINVSAKIKNEIPQIYQDDYTLVEATKNADLEGVKYLMDKEDRIPWGYGYALRIAGEEGHYEIVKYLIEFKDKSLPEEKYKDVPIANVLRKQGYLWYAENALDEAVNNGRTDIVKYLIKQRIRKFSKVLGQAAKIGNMEMVRSLVDQIGELTRIKKGAFDEAAYRAVLEGNLNILKYLVEKGARINVYHGDMYSPQHNLLSAASSLGSLEIVKYLVEQGVDIHDRNNIGFKEAVLNGHIEIVKYLVEQGANIHYQNEIALYDATWKGHFEIVKYLVEQGADIHAQEERVLIAASRGGDLEIVKYLVEQGADINAQKEQALEAACKRYHLEIVKYLVKQESNVCSCKK